MSSSAKSYYPVIGCKGAGGVFDRLPIETLQKEHPHQFALFILAFIAIQKRPDALQVVEEPAATFMEIASIHGKPYVEWAGDRKQYIADDFSLTDRKDTNPVPSRFGGYCNHGSVFFPTWHRTYVMLIEQSIGNIAKQLAHDIETNNPGENGVWVQAANELRFPYWDWAHKDVVEKGLPPVLYEETVIIKAPGGKEQTVNNPLSYFAYVGGVPSDFSNETIEKGEVAYFSEWRRTYRYALSTPDPEGSQIKLLQDAFKTNANDLRSRVGHLFSFNDDENNAIAWDDFSNHTAQSMRETDFKNLGSLEGVHDTVHILLGGNGHMNHPDYAAFDPIFFLHHSNVDRLFALWEWCYNRYWMGDCYEYKGEQFPWTQARGTYAQVYNEQLLPDGPLQPFRNEQGDYWTSSQMRFLDNQSHPKYYSYLEFEGIKVDKAATSSRERVLARKKVQIFYGVDPQTKAKEVALSDWKHLPVPNKEDHGVPSDHTVIAHYRTFVVHVKLPEHGFNSSYSFQLYHKGNNQRQLEPELQLVGTMTVFTRPDHSPCAACAVRREAGSVIRGMIPIPSELIGSIIKSNGGSNSGTTFDETIEHIKRELVGRLVDASGTKFAEAEGGGGGGVGVPRVPEDGKVSRRISPVEVSLVSVAHAEHVEDGEFRPVYLCDWKHHGGVFNGGWMATPRTA